MDTRQNTLRTLPDSALDELAQQMIANRNDTLANRRKRLLAVERERRRRLMEVLKCNQSHTNANAHTPIAKA